MVQWIGVLHRCVCIWHVSTTVEEQDWTMGVLLVDSCWTVKLHEFWKKLLVILGASNRMGSFAIACRQHGTWASKSRPWPAMWASQFWLKELLAHVLLCRFRGIFCLELCSWASRCSGSVGILRCRQRQYTVQHKCKVITHAGKAERVPRNWIKLLQTGFKVGRRGAGGVWMT